MSDKILLLLLFIGCLGAIKFSERFSQRNKIKPAHYFGIATIGTHQCHHQGGCIINK